jgi:hypothetical protein
MIDKLFSDLFIALSIPAADNVWAGALVGAIIGLALLNALGIFKPRGGGR